MIFGMLSHKQTDTYIECIRLSHGKMIWPVCLSMRPSNNVSFYSPVKLLVCCTFLLLRRVIKTVIDMINTMSMHENVVNFEPYSASIFQLYQIAMISSIDRLSVFIAPHGLHILLFASTLYITLLKNYGRIWAMRYDIWKCPENNLSNWSVITLKSLHPLRIQ